MTSSQETEWFCSHIYLLALDPHGVIVPPLSVSRVCIWMWRYEIISSKPTGIISGIQTQTDGDIVWSRDFPNNCSLSR